MTVFLKIIAGKMFLSEYTFDINLLKNERTTEHNTSLIKFQEDVIFSPSLKLILDEMDDFLICQVKFGLLSHKTSLANSKFKSTLPFR